MATLEDYRQMLRQESPSECATYMHCRMQILDENRVLRRCMNGTRRTGMCRECIQREIDSLEKRD